MKKRQRGFALLIAVIFMSVMLSFGLALGSLGYKQEVLASSAIESQYAFYAADAGLECALYADQGQGQNIFAYTDYNGNPKSIMCDGTTFLVTQVQSTSQLVSTARLSLDSTTSHPRCADVTIYKPAPGSGLQTYLFSQGYDISCDTVENPGSARFVSRGIDIFY